MLNGFDETTGKLTLGDAYVKWFRTQQYYDSGAWRGTWALDGGGALMNQGIHTVDVLLWLFGPVKSVMGRTANRLHRVEVEDTNTHVADVAVRCFWKASSTPSALSADTVQSPLLR